MISKLCYELYMIDWKRHHMITADREMDSIKDYYEFIEEADYNGNLYTYDDYIEEYGYDGELYVCYDEFLETEYLEEDYICGLLDNEKLIAMYCEDLKEEMKYENLDRRTIYILRKGSWTCNYDSRYFRRYA